MEEFSLYDADGPGRAWLTESRIHWKSKTREGKNVKRRKVWLYIQKYMCKHRVLTEQWEPINFHSSQSDCLKVI